MNFVLCEVIDGDDVYWSMFNVETGQKIAAWSDSDTPEEVLAKLEKGVNTES